MTLDDLKTGDKGRVVRVAAHGPFRKRLLEMGFVSGAQVEVVKYAPLRDPVEYAIMGYHVSLRHEEASQIIVEKM